MNKNLLRNIEDAGLSPTEAKVYLSLITLGPTSVIRLSKYSGVQRTNIYPTMTKLINYGIVKLTPKGMKTLYEAESPDKLVAILEHRKNELQASIPEIMDLYLKKKHVTKVNNYEGLLSIKNIYRDMLEELNPGDFYYVFSDTEKFISLDPEFFTWYRNELVSKKITRKMITLPGEVMTHEKEFERNYNLEIKFLPEGRDLGIDTMITPKRVTMITLTDPLIGISIENQQMVESQKAIFESFWKVL